MKCTFTFSDGSTCHGDDFLFIKNNIFKIWTTESNSEVVPEFKMVFMSDYFKWKVVFLIDGMLC